MHLLRSAPLRSTQISESSALAVHYSLKPIHEVVQFAQTAQLHVQISQMAPRDFEMMNNVSLGARRESMETFNWRFDLAQISGASIGGCH